MKFSVAGNARRAGNAASDEAPSREGFSLVEVIVGMIILSFALLGIAGALTLGMKQSNRANRDFRYTADVQQVADSLINLGFGNVTTGSTTVRGRSINWAVSAVGTNAQLVSLIISRRSAQDAQLAVNDTLSLYLAKGSPGS
jgi:prepilin-type N-terminal cleavage/methylation domain-containing protein